MRGKQRRWRLVGLLAAGMAIGVAMTATPAVATSVERSRTFGVT